MTTPQHAICLWHEDVGVDLALARGDLLTLLPFSLLLSSFVNSFQYEVIIPVLAVVSITENLSLQVFEILFILCFP